jgi:hypothetical protein
LVRFQYDNTPQDLHIEDVQALSGVLSDCATSASARRRAAQEWGDVAPMTEELVRIVDREYESVGAWRCASPYDMVIKGVQAVLEKEGTK